MKSEIAYSSNGVEHKVDTVAYLLNLVAIYIQCKKFDKAKVIIGFLSSQKIPGQLLKQKKEVFHVIVLFNLAEYKRCVSMANSLYKECSDAKIKKFLLLTLNKCFVKLGQIDKAEKVLRIILQNGA